MVEPGLDPRQEQSGGADMDRPAGPVQQAPHGRAEPGPVGGFWASLGALPLFLLAFGGASASMIAPAVFAVTQGFFAEARVFLYTALLGGILFAMIGLAMAGRRPRHGALGPLLSVLGVLAFLPLFLAFPFYESLRTTTYVNAYLEMVSAITTTGATLYDDPGRLSAPLHLWRAQVAWMGGLIMWVAAVAILAPLNLGGFEVTARAEPGRSEIGGNRMQRADPRRRVLRAMVALLPIYMGLTLILWVLLQALGDPPLTALCHAMAVLSTSGISPVGGMEGAGSGIGGEMVIVLFLAFAISRLTFSTDTLTSGGRHLGEDPEIRLALLLIITVPLLLFLRHWLGALDVDEDENLVLALRALWGSLFTVVSFLTTTGFASADWGTSQSWSGLGTPGLILMGLALMGGGVATTAGGVKLLRVFALARHGLREMERLVHPSSVSGARGLGRRLQRQGAYIAWIFFMLFALSLALISLVLAGMGAEFEEAIVLAIAALSNTGPLTGLAAQEPIMLADMTVGARLVFGLAMVLGRLEVLAFIALLTPELWRG